MSPASSAKVRVPLCTAGDVYGSLNGAGIVGRLNHIVVILTGQGVIGYVNRNSVTVNQYLSSSFM